MTTATDPIFIAMEQLDQSLTIDNKERTVLRANGPRPAWALPLLRWLHGKDAPDQYIMECVKQVSLTFFAFTRTSLMQDDVEHLRPEELYDHIINLAARDYAEQNGRMASDVRRWLMWRDGIHWKHIDDVLRSPSENPGDFEALISLAMEDQLRSVGNDMLNWLIDREADEAEAAQAMQAEGVEPAGSEDSAGTCMKMCAGCHERVNRAQWAGCRNDRCPSTFENMELPGDPLD